MSQKYAGKNLKIYFTPDGGQQSDISGKYRTFDVNETSKVAQVTSAESTYEEYVTVNLTDAKASYRALDTDDELNPFGVVSNGVQGTLKWYPVGGAQGKPRRTAVAIVTSRKVSFPYDNAVTLDAEFQIASAVTFDTVP